MKFVNKGKTQQVRQDDGPGRFKWKLLKTGETIELPEEIGLRYGLKKMIDQVTPQDQGEGNVPKITEGQIGQTKVETKQIEVENKDTKEGREQAEFVTFHKKLNDIDGIGEKTAKDIVKVFPTEEKLKEAISHDDELPFRDDVEKKLRDKYG